MEAFRTGGGDPDLPGVPLDPVGCGCHWYVGGAELMELYGGDQNSLSLAALADVGYTVDMSKAIPWRKPDNAAAVAAEGFQDFVTVEIVEPPGSPR